jgi:CrcB protein
VITVVGFVIASAVGALGRAEAGRRWNTYQFPVGTLIVNVSGSFGLGILVNVAPPVLTVVATGALGAFTTYSSFARDAVALVERRRIALAALYVTATLALGTAAAAVGVALTT